MLYAGELGSSLNQIQAASITRDGFAAVLLALRASRVAARACATVSPSARMRADQYLAPPIVFATNEPLSGTPTISARDCTS
jgi:hypothetical protein